MVTAGPSELEIVGSLERGKSIVNVLLECGVSAVNTEPLGAKTEGKDGEGVKTKVLTSTAMGNSTPLVVSKEKKHRVVDRRRRGGGRREMLGSEEEEEEEEEDSDGDSDRGSIGGSSDGTLSVLSEDLGEDDLALLDSMSDSSSEEEEEEEEEETPKQGKPVQGDIEAVGGTSTAVSATGLLPGPVKRTGKRRIVLAANFTMPPSSPQGKLKSDDISDTSPKISKLKPDINASGEAKSLTGLPLPPPAPLPPSSPADGIPTPKSDTQLEELMHSTDVQASVHTACSLVAEENSLMALRVFIYWLQSFPIIIATCTQVSVCGGWESLINAALYILHAPFRVLALCGQGLHP
jgi:hypothetical protein